MEKLVTKESLLQLLDTHDKGLVIGRALVAIFTINQTPVEQKTNDVRVWNNVGFTGADGRSGSLTAKYYLKHNRLEDWQIERWMRISEKTGMPRIVKYAKQLNEIANLKRTQK